MESCEYDDPTDPKSYIQRYAMIDANGDRGRPAALTVSSLQQCCAVLKH